MGKAIYWNGTTFQNIDDNSTITLSGDITGSGIAAITTALKTSGVTAGSYGSGSAIPVLTIDSKGRITAASTSAVSIPTGLTSGSASTGFVNYSGTTSTAGQLNGGTTAPDATTRLNYNGYLYATRIYNAVYNDYAEYFEKGEDTEPGDIVSKLPNGLYGKSQHSHDNMVVGVHSDSYGHCLGGTGNNDEENFIPIGLSGRVNVKVIGKIKEGDLIVSSYYPGIGMATQTYTPGTVIGKALENKNYEDIGKIKILIMNI